jgi:hypothetical protein
VALYHPHMSGLLRAAIDTVSLEWDCTVVHSESPRMKDIGEPDEGEPHVRFDEGGNRGSPLGRYGEATTPSTPKGGDMAHHCLWWLGVR